jgi:hypothetical protein
MNCKPNRWHYFRYVRYFWKDGELYKLLRCEYCLEDRTIDCSK